MIIPIPIIFCLDNKHEDRKKEAINRIPKYFKRGEYYYKLEETDCGVIIPIITESDQVITIPINAEVVPDPENKPK